MGIVLWSAGGLLAVFVARIIPIGGRRSWLTDIATGIGAGILGGAIATLLDFGGWREPEWRAALLAFLLAFAALGARRLTKS